MISTALRIYVLLIFFKIYIHTYIIFFIWPHSLMVMIFDSGSKGPGSIPGEAYFEIEINLKG